MIHPSFYSLELQAAIVADALESYPKECCGIVVEGKYIPLYNHASGDEEFRIAIKDYIDYYTSGRLQAVVHSHPKGPAYPSIRDMQQQIAMAVPFGIIAMNETEFGPEANDLFWFGDQLPIQPYEGRVFRHWVQDCIVLMRDYLRVQQGHKTKDYPRDPLTNTARDTDFINNHFEEQGFRDIALTNLQPGDCISFCIRAILPNHCGVYMGDGLILHHLRGEYSKIEPIDRWTRYIARCGRIGDGPASQEEGSSLRRPR